MLQKGWTALTFAIYYGYLEVAALLLSHDADMMIIDKVSTVIRRLFPSYKRDVTHYLQMVG